MRVAEIREAGRSTQGVKLINLGENEALAGLEKIVEPEEEPNGEPVNGNGAGVEPPAAGAPESDAPGGEDPDGGPAPDTH
jgi:DNA gyrase subunit A